MQVCKFVAGNFKISKTGGAAPTVIFGGSRGNTIPTS
jgi:hypothetical protein